MAHDIGDRLTLTATFRLEEDGDLYDPAAVTLTIVSPDGDAYTPTPDSDSLGIWTATFDPDMAGRWNYRWEGTGGVKPTAKEDWFDVRERRVP
jgi:hypothetical protein